MTLIHRGSRHGVRPDLDVESPRYWGDSAACRWEEPELFFSISSASLKLAQAQAVCARCPVRAECLQAALDAHADYGVRGGLSAEERRALHGRSVTGAERPETPRRAREIAAAPQEYLRLVGEGLSPYKVSRALRTNMQTINEVTRLLAEQEQGAQAPVEAGE